LTPDYLYGVESGMGGGAFLGIEFDISKCNFYTFEEPVRSLTVDASIVANALYFPFWTIHWVARIKAKQCWSKAQERHCANRL
jgi:hypothetical protein